MPGSDQLEVPGRLPPIFRFLQEHGAISDEEMYHVFNCGIGFILVVDPEESREIIDLLNGMGQRAFRIGEILPRGRNDRRSHR